MKKKNLFESKFLTSLRNRNAFLIKENEIDQLADDLETELQSPNSPLTEEEADLEDSLRQGNEEVETTQHQTMEDIKNEDKILKDKIQQRIESANQQIIDYAEKVESFLTFLNDPNSVDSMKYAMDNATENSPLGKVKKTCGTRIGRIAADIAGLGQELRSLIGSTSVDDMLK